MGMSIDERDGWWWAAFEAGGVVGWLVELSLSLGFFQRLLARGSVRIGSAIPYLTHLFIHAGSGALNTMTITQRLHTAQAIVFNPIPVWDQL